MERRVNVENPVGASSKVDELNGAGGPAHLNDIFSSIGKLSTVYLFSLSASLLLSCTSEDDKAPQNQGVRPGEVIGNPDSDDDPTSGGEGETALGGKEDPDLSGELDDTDQRPLPDIVSGQGQGGGGTPIPVPATPPPPEPEIPWDVPTPDILEPLWVFEDYCNAAHNPEYIYPYIEEFDLGGMSEEEIQLQFLGWHRDIQHTVNEIKKELKGKYDVAVQFGATVETPEQECAVYYTVFKTVSSFTLGPIVGVDGQTLVSRRIINPDPIAGLPNLKKLNLLSNMITRPFFLRRLSGLTYLELSSNFISKFPNKMVWMDAGNTVKQGLYNLKELGLENQGMPGEINFLTLYFIKEFNDSLEILRLGNNVIKPGPFRGVREDLKVFGESTLAFQEGSDDCKQFNTSGVGYPLEIEAERARRCDRE